jgi:hypothetical protein
MRTGGSNHEWTLMNTNFRKTRQPRITRITRISGEHTRLACWFRRLAETIFFNRTKRTERRVILAPRLDRTGMAAFGFGLDPIWDPLHGNPAS